jgi:hypothetical protein
VCGRRWCEVTAQEPDHEQLQASLHSALQPMTFDAVTSAAPAALYHYTTVEGMKGILEENELFATNLRFMNDRTELEYGLSLVKTVIAEQRSIYPPSSSQARILERCSGLLEFFSLDDESGPAAEFYGTCFCQSPDSLSQWRAYAKEGAGYALGFSGSLLTSSLFLGDGLLVKVIYDEEKQKELVKSLVTSFVDHFQKTWQALSGNHKRAYRRYAGYAFNAAATALIISFKHPSFESEQEWRYVDLVNESDASRLQFRPRAGSLVPYIRLRTRDGQKLPVVRVVHGPGNQQQTSLFGLRLFLQKHGLTDLIEVRRSNVPLGLGRQGQ